MLDIKKQLNNLIKIVICLCLTFTLLIVKPVSDVKASGFSFADIPGYADEMYAATMTAAMTVAAAGAHTHEFVQDNIELIREGAKSAYETLAPEAKASFIDSLNAAGDRIVIAGDWITHALDSLKADPVINPPSSIPDATINNAVDKLTNKSFKLKPGYEITVSSANATYVYKNSSSFAFYFGGTVWNEELGAQMSACVTGGTSVCGPSEKITYANYQSLQNTFNSLDTLTGHIAFASRFGITLTTSYDGTVLQGDESIYSQLDKRLRETDLPSGQLDNLRIPQTIPHTPTGRVLQLDTGLGGLTLDGIPYTGDVTWRTQTDAGVVLPVPIPMLADQPLVLTREGVLVNERGEVVTDVSNVTWVRPDITNVTDQATGKPKTLVKTITGELIDIITGEIINKKEFDPDDDEDDDDDSGGGLQPPCGCSVPSVVVNNNITIPSDDGGQGLSYCIDKATRQVVPCGEIEAIDGGLLAYVKNSYDYAVNAVKTASDGLKSIVEGSTGLIALYSNIFDWLPDQVTVILTSGLLLMIGLRVFRR